MVTCLSVTTPVSCTGVGGRGLFLNLSELPQPANNAAMRSSNNAARVRPLFILPLIPGRTLSEPDGLALGDETVALVLDRLGNAMGEALQELQVLCVVGAITIERDRRQEPDLEL